MDARTIRDALNRQPFEPFRVVLSNGEEFEIRHPEMALVLLRNLLIGYEEEEGFPTRFHVVALLHIAYLHPPDQVAQ